MLEALTHGPQLLGEVTVEKCAQVEILSLNATKMMFKMIMIFGYPNTNQPLEETIFTPTKIKEVEDF